MTDRVSSAGVTSGAAGVSGSGVSGSGVVDVPASPGYTASTTTWNPSDKNTNVALTNANLTTGTTDGAYGAVRATSGATSGKKYFEVLITGAPTVPDDIAIGFAKAAQALNTWLGSSADSIGWFSGTGAIYNNGATASAPTPYVLNDVVGVTFDLATGAVRYYKNGVAMGVAATTVSSPTGTWYPAAVTLGTVPKVTARFSPSNWTYTPPEGYDSWF